MRYTFLITGQNNFSKSEKKNTRKQKIGKGVMKKLRFFSLFLKVILIKKNLKHMASLKNI